MFFKKLYKSIQKEYLNYETLYMKIDFDVSDGEEEQSLAATVKIGRDSVVWVSIRKMNVEGARAVFYRDSVKIIDKVNKKAYVGTYQYLEDNFDVEIDYKILQSIFSNEVFTYPNSEDIDDPKSVFKSSIDSTYYVLRTLKKRKIKRIEKGKVNEKKLDEDMVAQTIYIMGEVYKFSKVYIREFGSSRTFGVEYENFKEIGDENIFPKRIRITASNVKRNLELNIKVKKVLINQTKKFDFEIDPDYELILCN
jgi:hypothetical protein